MYSVYQHWDPLQVCVVGRSYPPEFYSWIQVPHVRTLFERIARETEEDLQKIVRCLQSFGVEVVRPNLPQDASSLMDSNGRLMRPPLTPRDHMVMIGDRFYTTLPKNRWTEFYAVIKDPSWAEYPTYKEFLETAPPHQVEEVKNIHGSDKFLIYNDIVEKVGFQGNSIQTAPFDTVNGAMVSRIGRDLYFSTASIGEDTVALQQAVDREFPRTRNHVVNTGGHGDAVYCPVCPGLIISLCDVPSYAKTFPGWEVVYLPGQSWGSVKPFLDLKRKNGGRWWIPGFEYDQAVIETVETWLDHWVGYVEETVFDVNMLIINPTNVIVFNYNETVFKALERYGITPHVITFRHRYFWDGGVHCVTLDLSRQGHMQDYFVKQG